MMVAESKSRTAWVGKGDGEGASFCSARGTIHGLQKWTSMCAEPLRSNLELWSQGGIPAATRGHQRASSAIEGPHPAASSPPPPPRVT